MTQEDTHSYTAQLLVAKKMFLHITPRNTSNIYFYISDYI